MKRALVLIFAAVLASALLVPVCLQAQSAAGRTIVVMPFENTSPTPGLEWLAEAFPESFREQLNSPVLYVLSRDERLHAYDRLGIPAGLHPSRATLYRIAEQMDVDYALLGSYHFDGVRLTASAQLLDMHAQRLLPAANESGPLDTLRRLQSALAWDALRQIRSDFSIGKEQYISSIPPVRLDAFESYVRGLLAAAPDEKIQRYKEAVRLNPGYTEAWLELGKTYFNQRSYDLAMSSFGQVPSSAPAAREANFYLGLAAYYRGDFARAESAFAFVAQRLPLAEVYNNLGVVNARRGHKEAAVDFQRAIENDPSDPDYHFNLGVTLSRTGDSAGAARALRSALSQRPGDTETKSLLDMLTATPSGAITPASLPARPLERIKRNYEEDSFRLMTMQIQSWAEQRFARSDPRSHARFHVELGKELLAHGFIAEAEKQFREAGTLDPGNASAMAGLAQVAESGGDLAAARSQAEAALRIRESADAYLVLARLDLRENKNGSAAHNVNRAVELEPGNSAAQELKRVIAAKVAEKTP